MPVRSITLYPNPILREKASPADPADPDTKRVLQDLWETLDSHVGVGLAAPQIGERRRIVVVDASRARRRVPHHGRVALINPAIVLSEGSVEFREGCLSIPDMVARVRRADRVVVSGLDPEGRQVTLSPQGFEAVIFQHEIDHLDGILFIDRIRSARDLKPRTI